MKAAGNTLLLSEIALAETAAVIAAKDHTSSDITPAERDGTLWRFLQHCDAEYVLVLVNRAMRPKSKISDRSRNSI